MIDGTFQDANPTRVNKLRSGTVIDHLRPGTAMKVVELLGIVDGSILSIGMFFESRKMVRKDILKIENRTLTEEEISKLAVISPDATVCDIEGYSVRRKIHVRLPETVTEIIRCTNPNCITNHEFVPTHFHVESASPLKVRCRYCERAMSGGEIAFL